MSHVRFVGLVAGVVAVMSGAPATAVGEPACPGAPPRNGASCSEDSQYCSWGTDPRVGCRTFSECVRGKWDVTVPSCAEPAPACPASLAISSAGPRNGLGLPLCTTAQMGLTCVYGEDAYTCAPCEGTLCAQEPGWFETTLDPRCSASVPNFGDACSVAGLECNYNECADDDPDDPYYPSAHGVGLVCKSGAWTLEQGYACE